MADAPAIDAASDLEPSTKRARIDELSSSASAGVNRSPINVFTTQASADVLTARLLAALQPHRAKRHLEVEVRLCVLCDDRQQRVRLPIETPAVVTKVRRADAGVAKPDFDRIQQLLRFFAHRPQSTVSWTVRQSHTRDVISDGVRESFDAVTGFLTARVRKQRLAVCDISCPKHRYDLRFAVNQEVPLDEEAHLSNSTASVGDAKGRGYVREKMRTAFDCAFLSFDTTEVRDGGGSGGVPSFEVELEGALGDSCSSDAALVQAMIGNAFSLLDALASPSSILGAAASV